MSMAMAMASHSPSSESEEDKSKSQWPVPLTPPYPPLSKEVELRRAMAASDRSSSPLLLPLELELQLQLQLQLVFEDEWLCVVNKPAGIYCEAMLSMLSTSSNKQQQQQQLHLANRLDRDTSGLMLLTKHNRAAAALVQSFTHHAVSKTYLALSLAPAPAWRRAHISSGHGRSKHGAWRVYSLPDVHRTLPGRSRVKRMETAFQVLSINGTSTSTGNTDTDADGEVRSIVVGDNMFANTNTNTNTNDEVLLRAYPKSGRTHQIRLHCQYLGLPIRGDVKYGGASHWNGVECDSHALHAETLSFLHPITGVPLNLKAPPASLASEPATNTIKKSCLFSSTTICNFATRSRWHLQLAIDLLLLNVRSEL